MTYQVRRPPHLETLQIRGLKFQLYRWAAAQNAASQGEAHAPIVLIHGWGDTGETFQFLVDELSARRTLIAYDARGFGRTQWPQDGYWFADYLADLDFLLDELSPHAPVDLVGHSMGGNVAMLYAGVRSQRVRRLVNLEGFGMARTQPEQAPARYREWLDEVKRGTRYATYNSFDEFAGILGRRNPRTPPDRLDFIARSWGKEAADGTVELRADPRHKQVNPVLYQREQALACWRQITAPTQFLVGESSEFAKQMLLEMAAERGQTMSGDISPVVIPNAGHMLHHEQPAAVARLIDAFLTEP